MGCGNMDSCATVLCREDHMIEYRLLVQPHFQFAMSDAEVRFAQLLQDVVEPEYPCASLEWLVRALTTAAKQDEDLSVRCDRVVTSHMYRMVVILEGLMEHAEPVAEMRVERLQDVVSLPSRYGRFSAVSEDVMARLYRPGGPLFRTLLREFDTMFT